MRNWPARRERHARIEIIPMIDVMMFLLVFFVLISINVLPALGLKVTPPTSAHPDKVVERTRVTIGIDRAGDTYIDGKPISLAELPERLRGLASEDKPLAVVISGDEGAGLQSLVSVLDALKSAKVASASIVTRPQ
ncbi:biopolymer transporter ExbD [Methylosinus sporium]|uniref:Biopolymer transporter ExbD n=1 Tax=Methylosinus sporium TaxID=428 RepID=A0A549SDV9_METSR|nr:MULTISPECIES: biopolymer transporter ExbD [Methylosinus]MBU3890436.1 biopolymer transporter ExbD [Methylosinus sp. KRF6]TRL26658.1 biopolymer transporter ExbD [Methylosinus sporium]